MCNSEAIIDEQAMSTVGDFQASELSAIANTGSILVRNNRHVIYTIDTLKQATISNRQVSFNYYSLDYQKNRIYHNNGERYVVDPIAVVWNKDNYYLICYDDKHEGIAHYRVDRMNNAQLESTERIHHKEFYEFDVEKYRQKVFSMFGGEEYKV